MIAIVDTYYEPTCSRTGLLLINDWREHCAVQELVSEQPGDYAEYIPGEFYRRELPCILAAIKPVQAQITTIVIDGYVWLNSEQKPGLGAILYDALDQSSNVIGVAKRQFRDNRLLNNEDFGSLTPRNSVFQKVSTGCPLENQHVDSNALQILRGRSKNPLFITAVGVTPKSAAECIQSMHGDYRIPTLLKRVDQLSRGADLE